MRIKRRIALVTMAALVCAPSHAALVYRVDSPGSFGREVQRRIHRTLENLSQDFELCESGTITASDFRTEIRRTELLKIIKQVREALGNGSANRRLVQELRQSLKSIEKNLSLGVEYQRAGVLLAELLLHLEEEKAAKQWLKTLLDWSPEREIEGISVWEDPKDSHQEKLRAWVMALQAQSIPLCQVKLLNVDEMDRVWINGFEVSHRDRFEAALGRTYFIESLAEPGYGAQTVRCDKPGEFVVRLTASKRLVVPWYRLLQQRKSAAYLIVQNSGGASIFEGSHERGLERVRELKELGEVDALFENRRVDAVRVKELTESNKSKWYNDWMFWSVASVLVGGIAFAVYQSNQENSVPRAVRRRR